MDFKLFTILCCLVFSANSFSKNTPCSGKKGGISHCLNNYFVCNDGTISQSKQICPKFLKSNNKNTENSNEQDSTDPDN
ncbi:hypothetical protein DIZ81_13285 [Legionella taurinensis]|uniref:Uncharacterized protein n=1 Tax=Legionella taurinensis TaxID=70611 RepID=A0AB38N3S6_9GAMM|nr:hypothetical protein DB744_13295 [Legionella taurinensis]PUT40122.1 hypothetical protein DB746_12695 [Legionella taurinensis]PUT42274.1 hypothetical protein DB743_13180 [Legionella taurinensis]PUT46046.1 hypothetical protein DB745_12150 [Legionella taurinensis]TID31666.1 hypothetical protein DIZ41_13180 [Legionella taurinensis]